MKRRFQIRCEDELGLFGYTPNCSGVKQPKKERRREHTVKNAEHALQKDLDRSESGRTQKKSDEERREKK